MLPAEGYAQLAISTMLDLKARDIVLMDIADVSLIAEYFVVCTAQNESHSNALRDEITDRLEAAGLTLRRREGMDDSGWVLLDWGDIVVPSFRESERSFYDLERIWGKANITHIERTLRKTIEKLKI